MGRIIVHLHGKPKQTSYSALIEMYTDRLKGRNIKVETHSDKIPSKMVSNWGLNSEDVHLAIGPVDGWVNKDHLTSKNSIRLSKMTFPHELAGVLVLEQLYRASEIIKGTMYHRE